MKAETEINETETETKTNLIKFNSEKQISSDPFYR